MQSVVGVAIVFVFLTVISVKGDAQTAAPAKKPAVKCYTCHSCPDPFMTNITQPPSSATLQDCPKDITSCFKYHHSDKRIQKGCSPVQDECPSDEGGKFNLAWCYTCYGDKCNSARRIVEVSALPLITASVASLLGLAIFKRA